MADEKVIFEVDISSLSQAVIKAQADLDAYNGALEESIQETGKWSEETVAATAAVNAQSKAVKQAEGALLRVTQAEMALGGSLKDIVKNYDASNKSIDQNRKVLNALNAEYIKTVNPSKEFTARIKGISDALKQQEGAIGDTRRNVGNYAGDIINAFGGGQFTSAVANIGGISKGILGVANSLGTFKTALLTSGIGALALAVAGVATYFKAFEEGSELLERKLAGLGGAANVAISKFGQLGKSIVDSIGASTQRSFADNVKNIGTSIKDGLLAQGEGVLNTYKALGKVITSFGKEGGAELQDAILKTLTFGKVSRQAIADTISEADKAFKQAEEFTRQIQVLEEAEREYGLTVSKNATEVDRLRIAARSRGLDFEKQLELLAEAGRLEEINIGIETKNAEKRLSIVKQQTDLKREQGLVTEKVTQEEYDAQIKLDNLKRNSILLTEKINNQIDAVLDARRAQNTKEFDDFVAGIKAANEALTKGAAEQENTFVKIKDNSIEELRKFIRKKNDEYAKGAAEELAIEKQKEQDKQALVSAGFAFVTNAISSISQAVMESQQQELENDKAANDAAHENLQNRLDAGEISKKEYNLSIAKMDREMRDKEREANRKAWETNKAIQITMAVINTAQAIMAQLSNPTPYVGIALAALAAATGAIQIGIIAAQQPPKFARGVIGLDGAGTATSDSIDAKLSKGESVVTAKATQRFHRELAYMEMSVGNKPNYQFGRGRFAGGFIPTVSTDGGFVARQTLQSSDMTMAMQNAIRNGFSLAPAPVLSIVEFQNKQDSRNRSVKVSEA